MYTNDSIGGLLNATFGNATELIISGELKGASWKDVWGVGTVCTCCFVWARWAGRRGVNSVGCGGVCAVHPKHGLEAVSPTPRLHSFAALVHTFVRPPPQHFVHSRFSPFSPPPPPPPSLPSLAPSSPLAAFALKANLLRVVQLSLLGSVVSNLLLVMGTAFLAGGIFHASQTFSREAIAAHCALLLLSVIAMLLPTMLVMTRTQSNAGRPGFGGEDVYPIGSSSLILSRIESLMMFGCYILFLIFQLCTHKHLYEGECKYRHWVPPTVWGV